MRLVSARDHTDGEGARSRHAPDCVSRRRHIRVKLLDTTHSRAAAQLKAPIKLDGKSLNPEEIGQGIQALAQKLEALSSDARMTDIRSELETLETAQRGQAFWRDHGAAAVQLQQIEQLSQSVRRVSRLEERLSGLRARHASAETRSDLEQCGHS